MKILYVGNFADRDSSLGYSPNADWISNTFERLGHSVKRMDERKSTCADILQELTSGQYQMLLTEEGRLKGDFTNDEKAGVDILQGYFKPVMEYAREHKIPIVAWLTNIFMTIKRREIQVYQNPIFKADIVFSTDGGHDDKFKEAGVNHICLRQGIYGPEAVLGTANPDIKTEIVFIGAIYEYIWAYRAKLVQWLKKTYGERFAHVGQRGELRHQALSDYIATVKIVVGDSVYSPYYWSNRIYEMIGRGAFFIHPRVPGLDEEFTPYEHYIPYDIGNFGQLKEIIDYYLVHKEERDRIRLAGYEYCKKHHTYERRVKKMLDILKEKKII